MDKTAIFECHVQHEQKRIRFLEQNRGEEEARAFARRTLAIYRSAVVRRSAPAGEPTFRIRFIGSYCYLKRYLGLN